MFIALVAGVALGAVAGVMLAPDSGKRTRKKIVRKAEDVSDQLTDLIDRGESLVKDVKRAAKKAGAAVSGAAVSSPMQGTIVKVAVEEGQEVAEGDVVVVMEAMKMEQPLKAHKAGTVTGLQAEVGATVTNGAVICELKD